MPITFDTLKVVERFELAGVPHEHAKAFTEVIAELMAANSDQIREEHPTKNEFSALNHSVEKLDLNLRAAIEKCETNTDSKIEKAKSELVRWVVGVGVLQMSLIAALVLKLVGH